MKRNLMLAWICVLGSVAGLALLFTVNQRQASELDALRAENEELRAQLSDTNPGPKSVAGEARSIEEHQELLRLRNDVHQLGLQKTELARKLQTAEAQALRSAEQAQQAESQVQVLRANSQNQPEAPKGFSQQARERFMQRYGLVDTNAATPPDPEEAAKNECINNLRQIQGAKQQWALENNKPAGTVMTAADLAPYLPNHTLPKCPSGGSYALNAVGANPVCTVSSHVLPP